MRHLVFFLAFSLASGLPLIAFAQDGDDGVNSQDYDLFQGTHDQLQQEYNQGNVGSDNYDSSQDPPPSTYDPSTDIPPREVETELPQ